MASVRRELAQLRKDALAINERIAQAQQASWVSPWEMRAELAVAEAMCHELARRLNDYTEGHALPRPTRHEVRLLLEARRRQPRR